MYRFLVRLENRQKYGPKETLPLMIEFRKRVDKLGTVVKNFRIGERAIEFDLYATDASSRDASLRDLAREYGSVLLVRDLAEEEKKSSASPRAKEEVVLNSIDLFNEQRYWECHESMEQIWRREKDPRDKAVQQGVILSASALVHAQKDEDAICLGMIPRALSKLDEWTGEKYYSLNVATLRRAMEEILRSKQISYPKI